MLLKKYKGRYLIDGNIAYNYKKGIGVSMIQKYINFKDEILVEKSYDHWVITKNYMKNRPDYYISKIDYLYNKFSNRKKMSRVDNNILVALSNKLKNTDFSQLSNFFNNLKDKTEFDEIIKEIFSSTLNNYSRSPSINDLENLSMKKVEARALRIYAKILNDTNLGSISHGLYLKFAKIILEIINGQYEFNDSELLYKIILSYDDDYIINHIIHRMVDNTLSNQKLDNNLYNYLKS